jgi:protein-disulfide isomerase
MTARTRGLGRAGLAAVLLVAALSCPPVAAAQTAPALTREQIEEIVREYLLKHPDVILESVRAHQARQEAEVQARARQAVVTRRAEIFEDPAAPAAGNASGDVTVVEFFDYQCPHCKSVAASVRRLLAEDPNVRLIFKELPVLGPVSTLAARAALAAHGQGRYVAFHEALMAATVPLDRGEILRIAGQVGLDATRLQADMERPEVGALLERNLALARELAIGGTPAFVIGTEIVPGAVPLATLKELVARARRR